MDHQNRDRQMANQSRANRSQFLDQIGFAFAEDGRIIEIQLKRKNGSVVYLPCNFPDLATLVLRIEQAAGQAWELQRQALGGTDPRLMHPVTARKVARLQGAYSVDRKPLMTVVLTTGLRLELSLPENDIPELIAWLEEFERSRSKPKPSRN
jgi:hypothetical protein